MKKMMLAGLSAAGLVMSAGPVFAQDHNHSGHDHGAASEAPTMEECRAMHLVLIEAHHRTGDPGRVR